MLITCTGCDTDELPRLAFPTPKTEEAPRILLLWQGSWLAAIITGVVVWGLILWACVFHRRKSADQIPIQTRYNLPIEVLYTVLPFVMILVLFYFTERDQSILLDNDRDEDVTVNVVARQWSWSFNYVDANVYDAGTPGDRPQLVLPVNNLVRFELTSPDVIHSFWVSDFLMKMDVIPGRTNAFELTPNQLGTFPGKCAELCGTDHSRMLFDVQVVSEEQYRDHVNDLRDRGQTGQLPRGILDTKEDREDAYTRTGTFDEAAAPITPREHGSGEHGEGGH